MLLRTSVGPSRRVSVFLESHLAERVLKHLCRLQTNQSSLNVDGWPDYFSNSREKRSPNSPIFSVSRETVARRVKRACDLLGIDCPVLPRLRHTGPANDTLRGTKSLEQIRRRGRWASLKSVERCSKTAHIVADLAHLDPEVRRIGAEFLANPEAFTAAQVSAVRFS